MAMDPATRLIEAAVVEHRAGRYAAASRLYRRALAEAPGAATAFHHLGFALASAGQPELAPLQWRRAVSADPAHALYPVTLGRAFLAAEALEAAEAALRRALDLDPGVHDGVMLLASARARIARVPGLGRLCMRRWGTAAAAAFHPHDQARRDRGDPGYLVIRAWGCGFWGEVNHVAIQLVLAEIMGRLPLVFWGAECRYRGGPEGNAWTDYFEPVSEASEADLSRPGLRVFPTRWAAGTLWSSLSNPMLVQLRGNPKGLSALAAIDRSDAVVVADRYNEMAEVLAWAAPGHPLAGATPEAAYRRVYERSIRPRPELRAKIAALARSLFRRRPVLAVHYRAQHRFKEEESLERRSLTIADYDQPIGRFLAANASGCLFLLCDDAGAVEEFRRRYADRLIVLDRARLARPGEFDLGLNPAFEGTRLALEVLEDAYLAAECDAFLGDGASGVSCSILNLKHWPAGSVTLLRRNVFLERRWYLERADQA
jgi:hypothetical protein